MVLGPLAAKIQTQIGMDELKVRIKEMKRQEAEEKQEKLNRFKSIKHWARNHKAKAWLALATYKVRQ